MEDTCEKMADSATRTCPGRTFRWGFGTRAKAMKGFRAVLIEVRTIQRRFTAAQNRSVENSP
jgi:hypothetical protein